MRNTAPLMDEGTRIWIETTARKELWRVREWYDLADLVQDGYLCYYKCYNRYYAGLTKDHNKQMMALTKISFLNYIHTLASKRAPGYETAVSQMLGPTQEESSLWETILPSQGETGSFVALLANAPAEIKQLLELLAGDATSAATYVRRKIGRRQVRETNNEYFCRLLDLDPLKVNMIEQLKMFFA